VGTSADKEPAVYKKVEDWWGKDKTRAAAAHNLHRSAFGKAMVPEDMLHGEAHKAEVRKQEEQNKKVDKVELAEELDKVIETALRDVLKE
jgi:hypothetical protein